MKLGAARQEAGRAAALVKVTVPKSAAKTASLQFRLDRDKLRQVRAREGRYLLRSNLTTAAPEQLWSFYIQLTEVEQAFKELKHDLAVRPIFHRTEERGLAKNATRTFTALELANICVGRGRLLAQVRP